MVDWPYAFHQECIPALAVRVALNISSVRAWMDDVLELRRRKGGHRVMAAPSHAHRWLYKPEIIVLWQGKI